MSLWPRSVSAGRIFDPYRLRCASLRQWKVPQGPKRSVGLVPLAQPLPQPPINGSPRVQAMPTGSRQLDLDRNLPASVKRILANMQSDEDA